MGVILDSSVLIAGERRRDNIWEVLERVEAVCGRTTAALAAVTAVELTHGIYRAKTVPGHGAGPEGRESGKAVQVQAGLLQGASGVGAG